MIFVDGLTAQGMTRTSLALSLIRKSIHFGATCILPLIFTASAAFYAEPLADGTCGSDLHGGVLSGLQKISPRCGKAERHPFIRKLQLHRRKFHPQLVKSHSHLLDLLLDHQSYRI